ncbi:MAG: hypothetical protein EYC70_09475 [Planctomycetota bacterium]|nr:MAG: hypothetical protein EYC70_09475 [Planctomycetota bacterium]
MAKPSQPDNYPDPTETGRAQAQEAFRAYLERLRRGENVDRTKFLEEQPAELRVELARLLEDYDALSGRGPAGGRLSAGSVFGDFRLLRELGRGGMGVVWEAQQLSLQRRVALKLLSPQFVLSPRFLERFQREAQAGGRLAHIGIVQTYAFGEADGQQYIAQELVPGGTTLADTLAEFRKLRDLPEDYYRRTAAFFARVADALQYAHATGVVHRDIKPSNILIGEDDQPKVTDFGLAHVEGQLGLSRTGEMAGTPHYMSPEQAMSKRMGIDHRTDIFSLGATFYEALTLIKAFDGDTAQQILQKITLEDPPEPWRIRSRVPRELGIICMKALEKKRERRYATMREFAGDLRRFLGHQTIVARPPGTPTRILKWTQRHPIVSTSGAVAVAALVTITGLLLRVQAKSVEAREARQEADARAAEATRRSYAAYISAASLSAESGLSKEALRLLEACPKELRGWEWDHLRLKADASLRSLFGHTRDVVALAFSPDGGWLASAAGDGSVRLWDPATGVEKLRLDGGSDATALSFEPGGQQLAVGYQNGSVRVWDLAGSLIPMAGNDEDAVQCLVHSSDGVWLAAGRPGGRVSLWEAQTGRWHASLAGCEAGTPIRRLAFSPDGSELVGTGLGFSAVCHWRTRDGVRIDDSRLLRNLVGLHWGADGLRVAAAAGQGVEPGLWLIDPETGQEVTQWAWWSPDLGFDVEWSEEGSILAHLNARRGQVCVWPNKAAAQPRVIPCGRSTSQALALSAQAGLIAIASGNAIEIWDLETRGPDSELRSLCWRDQKWYAALACSPDGQFIAALSLGEVHVWQSASGHPVAVLDDLPGGALCFAFAPATEPWLVIACGDGVLRSFRTDGAPLEGTERLPATPETLAFSPDHRFLAAGLGDGGILIRDGAGGKSPQVLRDHAGAVQFLAFLADNRTLVSAAADREVRIRDVTTGEQRRALRSEGPAWTGSYAVSADGASLASATAEGVEIHDLAAGGRRSLAVGPETGGVLSLSFSPDGRRLATGCQDGTVRLWDPESGEQVAVVRLDDSGAARALFDPCGGRLIAHTNQAVHVLDSELAAARRRWHATAQELVWDDVVLPLFEDRYLLRAVLEALEEDSGLSPELKQLAQAFAQVRGEPIANVLSAAAHKRVRLPGADQHDRDKAVSFARAACERDPDNTFHRYVLGLALYRSGEFDRALATLIEADQLRVKPTAAPTINRARILAAQALCQQRLSRPEAAMRLLVEAYTLAEGDTNSDLRSLLAEAAELIGAPPAAAN